MSTRKSHRSKWRVSQNSPSDDAGDSQKNSTTTTKSKPKRKIRTTEDLNVLHAGDNSPIYSDRHIARSEIKPKRNKTRRVAPASDFLPQITQIGKDNFLSALHDPLCYLDSQENNGDLDQYFKPKSVRKTKRRIAKKNKSVKSEDENEERLLQDNTVDTTIKGKLLKSSLTEIESARALYDEARAPSPIFQNSTSTILMSPHNSKDDLFKAFSPEKEKWTMGYIEDTSELKDITGRETYDIVPIPTPKSSKFRTRKTKSTVIDALDSPKLRANAEEPIKKMKRKTASKTGSSKSLPPFSKEVIGIETGSTSKINDMRASARSLTKENTLTKFNKNDNFVLLPAKNEMANFAAELSRNNIKIGNNKLSSNNVLDNLNITKRSRNSGKSSSEGSLIIERQFVTLRRQKPYHSARNLDLEASTNIELNELQTENEQSGADGTNIYTSVFGTAALQKGKFKNSLSNLDNIFDIASNPSPTHQSDNMLENSLFTGSTLQNSAIMPELHRTGTFVKEDSTLVEIEPRRSTRKRWSQVERTSIFNKSPPEEDSSWGIKEPSKTPQPENRRSTRRKWHKLDETASISIPFITIEDSITSSPNEKSVMFVSLVDGINTSNKKSKNGSRVQNKKSVIIKSPLITPKTASYSSTILRKTPKPQTLTSSFILENANNRNSTFNCSLGESSRKSHPLAVSTPYPSQKENVNKKSPACGKNENIRSIKVSSKVKMPNFKKIHERQFEKMENIKDLQERRALRAQYLLSGCKLLERTRSPVNVDKPIKKKLMFNPVSSDLPKPTTSEYTSLKPIDTLNVPHQKVKRRSLEKKAELANKISNLPNKKTVVSNNLSKPIQRMLQKKRSSLEKKKTLLIPQTNVNVKPPKVELSQNSKLPTNKGTSKASRSNPTTTVSRFGFKLASENAITKDEQIKAISSKSKLPNNTTNEKRKQLNVGRTNRRFELLMQMRMKQK